MLNKRTSTSRPRPTSAFNFQRRKQARLNDNQQLDKITSNINKTFHRQNRSWNEIKELTIDRVGKQHEKTIDNLCLKYSITPDMKKRKWMNDTIDVDFLVKNHLRRKSLLEEKKRSKASLRKQIRTITSRYEKKPNKSFFTMSKKNLLSITRHSQPDKDITNEKHPYMIYYEEKQNEALKSIVSGDKLDLPIDKEYPPLFEAEQWQKDHFKAKVIYSGLNTFRGRPARQRKSRISSAQIKEFNMTD